MKTKHVLLLASGSDSRKNLLEESGIPFKVITQNADESKCDWTLPIEQLVVEIARLKMEHAILPEAKEGDVCFVVTADTMGKDPEGKIHGKPVDRYDAIEKLKGLRNGPVVTVSAFCLNKNVFKDGKWKTIERKEVCSSAEHFFMVPDKWIDTYLEKSWGYKGSGAIAIEHFGEQFSKDIKGSYSTIRGLPLFELRETLEELGFYE
ncbi:hypothetical protein HN446_01525 [bacterium]|jgi:septum formation protein|nr:hypothetical protein [bacterium]